MSKIEQAIEESILQDRIVHVEASDEEMNELSAESDDEVENGSETEYWGKDEEGNTWRVHATPRRPNVTDRAKRYRAQKNRPPGKKVCTFCGRRRNIDIDHITGDESDGTVDNLMFLCRACNTTKGIVQARHRIGIRTRQYNPARRRVNFTEFKEAARTLLGGPGDPGEATWLIRTTPPEQRAEFAERIAESNPFKSDAQRRKFYAMLERGEISAATLRNFSRDNPSFPTFAQYAHGVSIHRRGGHDEGGRIIHATPPAARHKYAQQIARLKRLRGEVPF
jgi:hypothetical protein